MEIIAATTGIDHALAILRSGGTVVHPTETCYGIACDLTNPDAVEKLFKIKKRPQIQPISALFRDIDDASHYVEWIDGALDLAKKTLPGPLTLVLPLRKAAPQRLFPTPQGGDTIGVRISPNPTARRLVEAFMKPISTTSANLHGQPNPYSIEDIAVQFAQQINQPDLILDAGTLPHAAPSTVMISKNHEWIVVR